MPRNSQFDNPAYQEPEPMMAHTFSLTPQMHDRLKATSKELSRPVSEVVRLAVERFLDELDAAKEWERK